MRFWLVILFIFAAVFFAYKKFFGSEAETEADRIEKRAKETKSVAEMITGTKPPQQTTKENENPPVIIKRPVGSKIVIFKSRPVPDLQTISNLIGRTNNSMSNNRANQSSKKETAPVPVRQPRQRPRRVAADRSH